MKIKLSYILIILLLPGLAEAIDSEAFLITIPGFPLSLGRLLFVISGFGLILKNRPQILKNSIFVGFLLMFTGITLASLLFDSTEVFIQSLGFFLLFIGAYGNVNLWERKWLHQIVDIFFILLIVYWTVKSFSLTFVSGSQSYSEMYREGEVINHHVPGMLVSISSAYLAVRFFYSENRLRLFGYLIFFISLLTCLYIESRSNFLVSLVIFLYIAMRGRAKTLKQIITVIPVLMVLTYLTIQLIQKNEILSKRFDFKDLAYQERTSGMRVVYFKEGIKGFTVSPLGKGISDTRVEYKGRNLMIHNQYLTFLLGGGVLTLVGLLFFFVGVWKVIISIFRFQEEKNEPGTKVMFALAISCLTFFITLFTIEMSGILFFMMVSYLLYVEKELISKQGEFSVSFSPINQENS